MVDDVGLCLDVLFLLRVFEVVGRFGIGGFR